MFKTNRISAYVADIVRNSECCDHLDFHPKLGGIEVIDGYEDKPREIRGEAPFVASFVIGLESGFGPEERFSAPEIRDSVMGHLPEGGTMITQLGWFKGSKEDSVRVTVENDLKRRSNAEFRTIVDRMIGSFIDKYRQEEIWLDYYQGSIRVDARTFAWVPDPN